MTATPIEEAMTDFLTGGQQAGWSASTIKTYGWHLAELAAWLAEREITSPEGITARLVRLYGAMVTTKWEPATCKVAVVAIRSWLKWAADEQLCDINLGKALKTPRIPEQIQRTVSAEEVESMLAACGNIYDSGLTAAQSYAANMRNQALVSLLFDAMLRAAEICTLSVGDVDMAKRTVFIRRGKGGADGVAHFSEKTAEYLAGWLEARPYAARAGSDAFFVSITGNTPGQRLTTNGLRSIMRALAKRAGVRHLGPHAFRRGGAVQAVVNGASSRVVRDMGRWKRLAMVETYTRSLDAGTMHEKFSPMRALEKVGPEIGA